MVLCNNKLAVNSSQQGMSHSKPHHKKKRWAPRATPGVPLWARRAPPSPSCECDAKTPYPTSSTGWPFDALRGQPFRSLTLPSGPASFSSVGTPSRGCEAFSADVWVPPSTSQTSVRCGCASGEREADGQHRVGERIAACLKQSELIHTWHLVPRSIGLPALM